jgi:Fur family ferric uptake transcriptional regulator
LHYCHLRAILYLMSCSQSLQAKGYRLTPQRLMVVDALHSVDKHISAEEIYAKVKAKYPYANISTVYRTLDLLKELGLVTEIDLGDGRIRYHPAEKGHHHHLVCHNCGKIIDLPEEAFQSLIKKLDKDYRFKAELKHMAIFGLCDKCRGK